MSLRKTAIFLLFLLSFAESFVIILDSWRDPKYEDSNTEIACISTFMVKAKVKISNCKLDSCLNGATCFDLPEGFDCECAVGFGGKNCEVDIDDCQHNPCHNGGTCTDLPNNFQCKCPSGWEGKFCETKSAGIIAKIIQPTS